HHRRSVAAPVPVRHLRRDHRGRAARGRHDGESEVAMATIAKTSTNVFGASLSRRHFVKTGGTLIVGMAALGPELLKAPLEGAAKDLPRNTPNAALASSWFEIRADNTMVLHTGKCDFGQSTVTTAYKQIVAEELNFPYDAITSIVMGDTDRTPDGGVSAGFLHL